MGLRDDTRKEISRVVWAHEILSFIQDPKNDIIHVEKIKKKLYHVPGRPEDLFDINFVILSPQVVGKLYHDVKVSKSEKILKDFSATVWHLLVNSKILPFNEPVIFREFDDAPDNILFTPQKTLAFIDTAIWHERLRRRWLESTFGWGIDYQRMFSFTYSEGQF